MSCILCFATLSSTNYRDFNLVDGCKSNFNVKNALQQLDIIVESRPNAKHICQACLRLLQRLESARRKAKTLEDQATKKHIDGAKHIGLAVKSRTLKRTLFPADSFGGNASNEPFLSMSHPPVAGALLRSPEVADSSFTSPDVNRKQLSANLSGFPVLTSTPRVSKASKSHCKSPHSESASAVIVKSSIQRPVVERSDKSTTVSIKVNWKSKTREKQLGSDLVSVGSMLCRGTYKQVAVAVWKHPTLRAYIIEAVCKEIDKECIEYCQPSKDKPGDSIRAAKILQNSPAKFKKAKVTDNATSCLRLTGKEDILGFTFDKLDEELKQQMPLARSVLMTMCWRRSKRKEDDLFFTPAVGMAAAICLKNRSKRMTAVQLILSMMMQHSGFMATLLRLSSLRLAVSHTFLYKKLDEYGKDHLKEVQEKILKASEHINSSVSSQIAGHKLIIDNFNFTSEPHQMTAEHQNKCVNWVGLMITENRVSGSSLRTDKPALDRLVGLDNGLCIPNTVDHNQQRLNYIALCGRLAVENISCLKVLEKAATQHIPHRFSSRVAEPTNTVFAKMIYEDQNDASGMQKVMTDLHSFVPCDKKENPRRFGEQGVVGDQLTVERGVSCLLQLSNGFTPEDRLDGLHLEIADFHGGMKFLQVAFDNLYSPKSTSDKCTMFSDKVIVNRRNVNTDVSRKVEGCKQFFILEVNARIIACYCEILGISNPDDEPENNEMLGMVPAMTIRERKDLLDSLSAKVVDRFIIRKERNAEIVKRQINEDWLMATNVKNAAGQFLCRKEGCSQTFKFDGKRRRDHEISHGLHKEVTSPSTSINDDMFNYQCSLLDIGMVILNFFDAVSEGDGLRVVRCWKFMLQYLKVDGSRSRKYALEALYLLFQIHAILPERDAHHLIWNRFSKSRRGGGGNIPLDLALEHYNNLLKSVVKNLGPNSTNTRAIDRFCKALTVNKKLLENFDRSCHVIRRSGVHVKANLSSEMKRIVSELMKHSALQVIPGRKYEFFAGMKPSLLEDFNVHEMYKWIKDHKTFVQLHKAGR